MLTAFKFLLFIDFSQACYSFHLYNKSCLSGL